MPNSRFCKNEIKNETARENENNQEKTRESGI